MADKHSLNCEVRELKLGASFTNNKASQYHTIKYDFKPASVDVNKMATVDVGTNNQVTVTVPHLDGAGVPQTVFKGSQRPYAKECVLIIDRVTGEITLEKLSSNIQVKKTRQETSQKPRPLTPVTSEFTNTTQRSTSRTRVATNRRANPPNPVPAAGQSQSSSSQRFPSLPPAAAKPPQSMVRSPPRQKTSPPQAAPWSGGGNSTLASLPMIGLDDALGLGLAPAPAHAPAPAPAPAPTHNGYGPSAPRQPERNSYAPERSNHVERPPPHAPALSHATLPSHATPPSYASLPSHVTPPSYVPPPPPPGASHNVQDDSSSSSSSDSGSDSDSDDSDDNDNSAHHSLPNGTAAGAPGPTPAPAPALPSDVLNDDLCLSESGSDSD